MNECVSDNFGPSYVDKGYATPTLKGNPGDVTQDVRTTFFVLLAIYFPAVTGIFTGANMSGQCCFEYSFQATSRTHSRQSQGELLQRN